jgi:hypothetical protein
VRGFRIELGEVEAALASHPAVRDAAVVARPDAAGEIGLVAYVAIGASGATDATPPTDAPSAHELRRHLERSLPAHMIPAAFVILTALPLTAHGKVDRKALPAPDSARADAAAEHVEPRTEIERSLAALWSGILGLERVGVRDDFFLLGGHSLSATRILARMRETLGADVSLAVFFETRTIEGLAGAVAALAPPAVPADDPAAELHALYTAAGEDAMLARAAALSDADLDALLARMTGQEEGS